MLLYTDILYTIIHFYTWYFRSYFTQIIYNRTMGKPRKSDGLPLQVHNFLQQNAENGMLLITAVDNTKEIQIGAG